ncbi:hypothetical protein NQ317_015994 [Molorchus minor]|uniref:Uncharacterized protein n=1 Tax=Molorchus minor TaxID=1323400 RepID=A0ABQ9JMC7_9CUCU|nr:hypothetical protein NQ317_015994 [Molorchus minor]
MRIDRQCLTVYWTDFDRIGDTFALNEARNKINQEFKKQKHVTDVNAIEELINYTNAVENELRTCVIQAKKVAPGKFKAEIREETVKLDNVPYKDCPTQEKRNK